ncbi:MAG: hypothetical protein IJZ80_08375 [Clostridia bacterium]|nr:hypothetical protein [Clostridia bacterium]
MAKKNSTYSLPVRIMAIAMTVLVSSGVLVYLVMLLLNLLGVSGGADIHIH